MLHVVLDLDHDRRLGKGRPVPLLLLVDDPETDQAEETPVAAQSLLEKQLKRPFSRFVKETPVLKVLYLLEDLCYGRILLVDLDTEFPGLEDDIASTRKV